MFYNRGEVISDQFDHLRILVVKLVGSFISNFQGREEDEEERVRSEEISSVIVKV